MCICVRMRHNLLVCVVQIFTCLMCTRLVYFDRVCLFFLTDDGKKMFVLISLDIIINNTRQGFSTFDATMEFL